MVLTLSAALASGLPAPVRVDVQPAVEHPAEEGECAGPRELEPGDARECRSLSIPRSEARDALSVRVERDALREALLVERAHVDVLLAATRRQLDWQTERAERAERGERRARVAVWLAAGVTAVTVGGGLVGYEWAQGRVR